MLWLNKTNKQKIYENIILQQIYEMKKYDLLHFSYQFLNTFDYLRSLLLCLQMNYQIKVISIKYLQENV